MYITFLTKMWKENGVYKSNTALDLKDYSVMLPSKIRMDIINLSLELKKIQESKNAS